MSEIWLLYHFMTSYTKPLFHRLWMAHGSRLMVLRPHPVGISVFCGWVGCSVSRWCVPWPEGCVLWPGWASKAFGLLGKRWASTAFGDFLHFMFTFLVVIRTLFRTSFSILCWLHCSTAFLEHIWILGPHIRKKDWRAHWKMFGNKHASQAYHASPLIVVP